MIEARLAGRRIDQRYVHKVRPENVLIGDVRRISTEPEEFECEMIVDPTHPFFFEHPLDHIPGMMFLEAGRQLGIAASHLFLGVPFGTQFISREFVIRFDALADLAEPVIIRSRFLDRGYRHGAVAQATLQAECLQGGHVVCSMEGDWKMYPGPIYQRLRNQRKNLRS